MATRHRQAKTAVGKPSRRVATSLAPTSSGPVGPEDFSFQPATAGLVRSPPEAFVGFADDSLLIDDELFDPTEGMPGFEIDLRGGHSAAEVRAAAREYNRLETRGVTSHTQQGMLWRSQLDFTATVIAKLRECGRLELTEGIGTCHTECLNLQCTGCKKTQKFWNRCDLFFCPNCQPRLARERLKSVEWWTEQIRSPKHVVLTLENTKSMTPEHVKHLLKSFARLRRMAFCKNWTGGFFRVEVTNEGKGWHLHIHALVDCRFIPQDGLAVAWNQANRGTGYIVRVLGVHGDSYLREVTKYAVKGSEIAKWSGPDIAAFIDAFKGRRTFGVFGKLYKLRAAHREAMTEVAAERATCDCGCTTFKVRSDAELEWLELKVGCPVERRNECEKKPVQLDLGIIVRDAFNLFG